MNRSMTALRFAYLPPEQLAALLEFHAHGDVSILDARRDVYDRVGFVDSDGDLRIDDDLYEGMEGWSADAWGRLMSRFEITLEEAIIESMENPDHYGIDEGWLACYGDNFRHFLER